jgi:iron-sulfur cluster assembly protein
MKSENKKKDFPLTLTPKALEKLGFWMEQRPIAPLGIRINLKTRGCSGLSYALEYVETPLAQDEQCQFGKLVLFVSSQAALFLLGTVIDYEETPLHSGFVFQNPNEKGRCGCGESFRV